MAMLYSSGTTGQPKGILRPLPDVAPADGALVLMFAKGLFGFREEQTYLSPAPLYHSAPQASVSATIRLGGTAVIMERFDPEQWLELVEQYKVTHCADGADDVLAAPQAARRRRGRSTTCRRSSASSTRRRRVRSR